MRIDRLIIKNFKGFAEESFQLNPRFTVFIGDNAKGKTSVLNALSVAMGSFLLGIEGVDSRTILENEVRLVTIDGQPKPQKPVSISAEWLLTEMETMLWKNFTNKTKLSWKREKERNNTDSKNAKDIKLFAESLLKESRKQSGIVFPVLTYYGTGRLWAVHEKLNYQKQEEGVKMAYTNALSAKASSKEFLEWFKTQEDSVKKFEQSLEISHLQAFKKAITTLIPDDRWQDLTFDNKLNELVGVFTTDSNRKEILKFSQLSDGFRNMVAIAGDLAFRCIQLNPHLKERAILDTPGIVLIDEIDMHLHPNWQRRIVNDLKNAFPKIQFVATTHSPFIVQSLESDELRNLDNSSENSSLLENMPISKISTEVMNVKSGRSDDFDARYKAAKEKFLSISNENNELTLTDLQKISDVLGSIIKDETNDPVYKAYLDSKDEAGE